jgi:D-glycero-D-manno-heptose 1,7-bisphosphate phosphatase
VRRCVFFDRDGVVNRSPGPDGYVTCWAAFQLEPAFVEAARVARARGYVLAVATNQRGVALGLVARATVVDLHRRLAARLREAFGLELLETAFCPHDRDEGCACRKPAPGLLRDLARRHGLDLARSWMVGDAERDVEAGRRAGCRTILVGGDQAETRADHRVRSLADLPGRMRIVLDNPVPSP